MACLKTKSDLSLHFDSESDPDSEKVGYHCTTLHLFVLPKPQYNLSGTHTLTKHTLSQETHTNPMSKT
jgi:hypothetical protein